MSDGSSPRYGWYGDDFTGATDTLATLAQRDLRALLFLGIPTTAQLAAAGPLEAIGIAGATRAMAPAEMAAELDAAGRFFARQGVGLLHYKCCSTFDSAPHVGSLGAAFRALRPHFVNPFVPIVGGQPNLGRYCMFGNLFAAAGSGGAVHRIDRHPTMSEHPVTPMVEADLRRHLGAQDLSNVALLDFRAYEANASAQLADCLAARPDAVLLDVSRPTDLAAIGGLISERLGDGPMLSIGPSSVAQAYAEPVPQSVGDQDTDEGRVRGAGSVLVLVGSLSPVTRAQVEAARGYPRISIDPIRLLHEPAYADSLKRDAMALLAEGDAMLVTERPERDAPPAAAVASATAHLLRAILADAQLSRLVIAGGDTSSLAVKALDIWGLSYRAPFVPGAPLCRTHSDDPRLHGLDIILKGGQMGPIDVFLRASARVVAATDSATPARN